ncbi:MAG: hypothetical protein U9R14_02010 [Patescibacteria group bacterium]|nr:hypothetical protein [Patescibacteria group bacterium]
MNFFKKKKQNNQSKQTKNKEKKRESNIGGKEEKLEEEKFKIGNDIIIHTMPKRFRFVHKKANKAKTTGLLIIAGGAVFFIAIIVLFFCLFKIRSVKPELTSAPATPGAISEAQQSKASHKDNQIKSGKKDVSPPLKATSTKQALPDDNKIDTVAATTTLANGTTAAATSTLADFIKGVDSDNDGLTDKEEKLLGSGLNNMDSDGDGYNDLTEAINLYNPVKAGDDKLINNPGVNKYLNNTFNYNLLYPNSWAQSAIVGGESVMFKSNDNHFIQVIVQPNIDHQDIENWHKQQFDTEVIDQERKITTNSWQGIKSEDGLIIYLTGRKYNYIFTITYNTGLSNKLDYANIFAIAVKSFEISD